MSTQTSFTPSATMEQTQQQRIALSIGNDLLESWPSRGQFNPVANQCSGPAFDSRRLGYFGCDKAQFPMPATNFPKPLHSMPARTRSDSRDYATPGCLIEDWPSRPADDNAPTQRTYNPRMKEVKFSPSSSLHMYQCDSQYPKNSCYSRADRKELSRETYMEARRIRALAAQAPGSGSEAIRYLIENGFIIQEEILGIEHLVIDKAAARIMKERERHAEMCLAEYQRQKMENCADDRRLAQISAMRSGKSAKRARIRAALAA